MARGRRRVDRYFRLDPAKIKRAQKALRAATETETIERALDLAIRNRLAEQANERFVNSWIEIQDVYGTLTKETHWK
jgi:putative heme iron utilization protein